MNREENPVDLDLGDALRQATEVLCQTKVSDELIQRCRQNALLLDEQVIETPRVQLGPPQSSWVDRWLIPAAVAASIVMVMNLGQIVARLPPRDRQLAGLESMPDGSTLRLFSDHVAERVLNTKNHETGKTR